MTTQYLKGGVIYLEVYRQDDSFNARQAEQNIVDSVDSRPEKDALVDLLEQVVVEHNSTNNVMRPFYVIIFALYRVDCSWKADDKGA